MILCRVRWNLRRTIVLAALSSAAPSFAVIAADQVLRGGMDSGGAGLYGSDHNPWFLENTPGITYCLDSDPTTFHQSLDVVDDMIRTAFDDWRSAFRASEEKNPVSVPDFNVLRVGTQSLRKVDCKDQNVDLRFQLGVLNEDQKKKLGGEHEWIGATYRTDYDEENMRGKGFIYIAADSGPERPTSTELIPDFWRFCDGCLLRRTIVHELGHVFGLGHVGNDWDIMSEGHLQKVTSTKWASAHLSEKKDLEGFESRSRLRSYLSTKLMGRVRDCQLLSTMDNRLRGIFGVPWGNSCFYFIPLDGREDIAFAYGRGADFDPTVIFAHTLEAHCEETGKNELAWLYLPPTQRVFKFSNFNNTFPGKLPILSVYERTICFGTVREFGRQKPRSAVSMTLVFSRDGSIVGTAIDPRDYKGFIFSTSFD